MTSQSSPRTPQSVAMDSSTPSAPSKSIQSQSSDYSLRIIEPIPMADTLMLPPDQQAATRAGRTRGGHPASPSHRSPPSRAASPSRSPAPRGQWALACAHSCTADYEGSVPSEGHREAPRAITLRWARHAGRCTPGGDVKVAGVLSGQPKSATHPCGWTKGWSREGAAPAIGSRCGGVC